MSEEPIETRVIADDRVEILDHYVSRGSVPAVPKSASTDIRRPSIASSVVSFIRQTATANLSLSLIFLVLHLLAAPALQLIAASVTVIISSRGQSSTTPGPNLRTLFQLPNGEVYHWINTAANGALDTNDGLAPTVGGGHGPWLTPNHGLPCGDIILAVVGDYSSTQGFQHWGTNTTCPSTSGGIDGSGGNTVGGTGGTGGVYGVILLCASPSGSMADMGSNGCILNCSACNSGPGTKGAMIVQNNNWFIEGWQVGSTSNTGNNTLGFVSDSCTSPTTQLHHIGFINDLTRNMMVGYGINDCGNNHNVPGNGADYWATILSLAWNSNNGNPIGGICAAGISLTAPSPVDSSTQVSVLSHTSFSYAGANALVCGTDMEGFILDTWDAHGYQKKGGVFNSMFWNNYRFGLSKQSSGSNTADPNNQLVMWNTGFADAALPLTNQTFSNPSLGAGGSGYTNGLQDLTALGGTCTIQPVYRVTVTGGVVTATTGAGTGVVNYGSCTVQPTNPVSTSGGGGTGATLNLTTFVGQLSGEINFQESGTTISNIVTIQNNITKAKWTASGGITPPGGNNGSIWAQLVGASGSATASNYTIGGTGTQNIYKGQDTTCRAGTQCQPGAVGAGGTCTPFPCGAGAYNNMPTGTNFYEDPAFANESDLLTNWVGNPNCSGKRNIVQCMGYDPSTGTLTTNTPIADLQASCADCSGKGFQLPSTTCSSAGPAQYISPWLKAVIYLEYDPATGNVYQYHDGVTTPCGL